MFRQARWPHKEIFDLGEANTNVFKDYVDRASEFIPDNLLRREPPMIPDIPEFLLVRHYTRLSQMNYGVDLGLYPLGSCTMKYNPRLNEEIASEPHISGISPYQREEEVQGILKILYELAAVLSDLTGMDRFSLQPAAGAQGEFVGCLIIKKYFEVNSDGKRDTILIPETAHGTNPASAKMAGFKVMEIPSDERGMVDPSALKNILDDSVAGMMLTNPNTLGVFEEDILEIADVIHGNGSLLYYDGANFNALMGFARPGDMGFDIMHLNLHKTFSTPHGGGGPGAGPVGVKEFLGEYLPVPVIEYSEEDGLYRFKWDLKHSIGRIHFFYGNISVLIRAYAYIKRMGYEGLKKASLTALINSNYLFKKLSEIRGFTPYPKNVKWRMHESVFSLSRLRSDTGVRARDFAKRMLDYGVYAPTVNFPLNVDEALMIEPTETVSKSELDYFIWVCEQVSSESYKNPEYVKKSPYNTSVGRIDDAYASRFKTMKPTHRWRGVRG